MKRSLSVLLLLCCLLLPGCAKRQAPARESDLPQKLVNTPLTPEQIRSEITALEALEAQGKLDHDSEQRLLMLKSMVPAAGNQLQNITQKADDSARQVDQLEEQNREQNTR